MHIRTFSLLICLLFLGVTIQSQTVKSPSEFLGYPLGTQFSRHHQVVDYFKYLAETLPSKIKLEQYGSTYENRPLYLVYVSNEANMTNLEQIRTNNLKSAGIIEGATSTNNTAIVWLSYNVHGNEASSTEASMSTIYKLLTEKQDYLKNTVVIIDPCVNPDGRDRYVNWYNQTASKPYNTNKWSSEHNEPWPGGRPNHYFFDLNRDWAWATQIETQSRLKVYNQWLPHIHVDFHEQGINNPYYFAPAAEPFHDIITDWQRDLQTEIGKNHAKYFDSEGWLYFTKEVFDLVYPSYGDTYPMYSGAIGMTYEQAGHGMGGLGVLNDEAQTLTLVDRALHHTTTGLSTIEVASKQAEKITQEFKKFFTNDDLKYKSYALQGDADKIEALTKLLDKHQISYGNASQNKASGFSYSSAKKRNLNLTEDAIVVSTNQPKGKFVSALFEPKTNFTDSLTYDITAWSLPYAYGLEAIASEKLIATKPFVKQTAKNTRNDNAIGYMTDWNHLNDAKFLTNLIQQGLKIRFSEKPITTANTSFKSGALIILKSDNTSIEHFDDVVFKTATSYNRTLKPVLTGFSTNGPDFGSSSIKLIAKPNIAILSGEHTQSLNYGAFWHFFEQDLNYPITNFNTANFRVSYLDDFDVLILPSGNYRGLFSESALADLKSWIQKGGKVIVAQRAINTFANQKGFSIKTNEKADDKKSKDSTANLIPYADRERNAIKDYISGAIFKTKVDATHPIAFGYDDTYFSLKLGTSSYKLFDDNNYNVAYIGKPEAVSGLTGSNTLKPLENSMVIGQEHHGRGSLIYFVDDVLFRGFWENGKLFMANAIFFAN